MLFDNRWNQPTCTSLTLLLFGLWAPAIGDAHPCMAYHISSKETALARGPLVQFQDTTDIF